MPGMRQRIIPRETYNFPGLAASATQDILLIRRLNLEIWREATCLRTSA
jgi:hypothetical protein